MKWTEDRVELLVININKGLSYKEISSTCGLTEKAVKVKCYRLGIKQKSPSIEEIICATCNSVFKGYKLNNRKFCSSSCSVTYSNKNRSRIKKINTIKSKSGFKTIKNSNIVSKLCLGCNLPIKHPNKYCSGVCHADSRRKVKAFRNFTTEL